MQKTKLFLSKHLVSIFACIFVVALSLGVFYVTSQTGTTTIGQNLSIPGDLTVTGTVQATSFEGSGSGLAGVEGVPSGGIIMWSGTLATIPSGWALCDGTNGTPDLRDRFVMGSAGGVDPGVTGGASSKTLTTANMPSHSHTFSATTSSAGAHTHSSGVNRWDDRGGWGFPLMYCGGEAGDAITTSSAGAHTHTVSGTSATQGSGTAFDNRPAFYALAFIMKL